MEEFMLEQRMPHSVEAEQAVLGSVLIDPSCLPEVISQLRGDDFHLPQNRDMFRIIAGMMNNAEIVDPVTVKNAMLQTGSYEADSLRNYMVQLMEITPTSANVSAYIEILKDKTILRKLSVATSEIATLVQEGTNTGPAVLELAEQKIYAIRQGRENSGLVPINEVLNEMYDHLSELSKNNSDLSGLSTGLGDLDKAISGLNKSDLILLAARPGMGKTSMALNLLLHVGKSSGKSVAFFSLEMSRVQLALRLIATESFVDNKKLTTGQLSEKDWESVVDAATALTQTKILINDDSMITVSEINAKCRRIPDLGLVIIDYLQLMQSAGGNKSFGGENRQQVVSDISRTLKIMAKELNVPVICLSQLSRASEKRENKRPMLSDLRESGAIEQDADIVMFLYREDYYEKETENHNVAECIIAKNRHGETNTVELEWLPQFTTFRGIERRFQEPY